MNLLEEIKSSTKSITCEIFVLYLKEALQASLEKFDDTIDISILNMGRYIKLTEKFRIFKEKVMK
jgi:hypothetical protein